MDSNTANVCGWQEIGMNNCVFYKTRHKIKRKKWSSDKACKWKSSNLNDTNSGATIQTVNGTNNGSEWHN